MWPNRFVKFAVLVGIQIALCHSAEIDFGEDIRPILSDACYHCHGPDSNARSTDLRLDSRSSTIESGVLESGELIERLQSDDPDFRMPPGDSKRVLNRKHRAKLVAWAQQGAPWPEDDRHWSFVPIEKPAVPLTADDSW